MSNDPVDGGTVTQQIEGQIVAVDFEAQTITLSFAEDARVPLTGDATVTFATPPEPAPLVVTCNGHSIELSDEEAAALVTSFAEYAGISDAAKVTVRLARLLRGARQDPQPASDTHGGHVEPMDDPYKRQPEQDDTASGIDFDALPDGTVLLRTDGRPGVRIKVDGVWTFDGHGIAAPLLPKNWKVHQPAPLSPGECLRGLLAGRDDADELIEYAKRWGGRGLTPDGRWRAAVGDAARQVHG